jgi:arsenite methyltransferase
MTTAPTVPDVDLEGLRCAIRNEYAEVASNPDKGFHFHTGRALTQIVGYNDALLEGVPESAIESFAGTGNPFLAGGIEKGSRVADIGSGAGIDSLIAARMVGGDGQVVGIDMTEEMRAKATAAAAEAGYDNVEFRDGYTESLPIEDNWADVVISNGVLNLSPDKVAAYSEIHRILRPGGRLQIADILVEKPVPDNAKRDIDLWKG